MMQSEEEQVWYLRILKRLEDYIQQNNLPVFLQNLQQKHIFAYLFYDCAAISRGLDRCQCDHGLGYYSQMIGTSISETNWIDYYSVMLKILRAMCAPMVAQSHFDRFMYTWSEKQIL